MIITVKCGKPPKALKFQRFQRFTDGRSDGIRTHDPLTPSYGANRIIPTVFGFPVTPLARSHYMVILSIPEQLSTMPLLRSFSRSMSSAAFSKDSADEWVYIFDVIEMSECPINSLATLMGIPAACKSVQYVCRRQYGTRSSATGYGGISCPLNVLHPISILS